MGGVEICHRLNRDKTMTDEVVLKPCPDDLDRNQALLLAKLSEQAERYDDMVKYMKQIVKLGVKANELTVEERNLLSVGYKNMMSHRRTAWRTVQQNFEKNSEGGAEEATYDEQYRKTIAQEVFNLIKEVCEDIVEVYVTGANKPDEGEKSEVFVFFKKMEGDYNRMGQRSRRVTPRGTRLNTSTGGI